MSQPVDVYPNTVTRQPSPHSNGSFGTVFIVLAVIVVISAIACFLGRLCSRRYHHSKAKQNPASRPKEGEAKQSRKTFRPKEGEARQNHTAFHPKEGEARQNHTAFHPKEGEARQNHAAFHPKEGEARQKNHTAFHPGEEDIEFGFDVGIPTAKMAGNGRSKGPKLSENGDQFKEVRFAHDG